MSSTRNNASNVRLFPAFRIIPFYRANALAFSQNRSDDIVVAIRNVVTDRPQRKAEGGRADERITGDGGI